MNVSRRPAVRPSSPDAVATVDLLARRFKRERLQSERAKARAAQPAYGTWRPDTAPPPDLVFSDASVRRTWTALLAEGAR